MLRHAGPDRSAPIWLFSFVDLAFLLLIAFTQAGPRTVAMGDPVGLLDIPRLETAARPIEESANAPVWLLRVHPPLARAEATGTPPARPAFELLESSRALPAEAGQVRPAVERIDARELAARLELLRARKLERPVLAPHRDSRSEDLLVAVGLLETTWQGRRAVAVLPGPPVAARATTAPRTMAPLGEHDTTGSSR